MKWWNINIAEGWLVPCPYTALLSRWCWGQTGHRPVRPNWDCSHKTFPCTLRLLIDICLLIIFLTKRLDLVHFVYFIPFWFYHAQSGASQCICWVDKRPRDTGRWMSCIAPEFSFLTTPQPHLQHVSLERGEKCPQKLLVFFTWIMNVLKGTMGKGLIFIL